MRARFGKVFSPFLRGEGRVRGRLGKDGESWTQGRFPFSVVASAAKQSGLSPRKDSGFASLRSQ